MSKIIVKCFDINGEHFLLNEECKPMLFDSKEQAINYLKTFGFTDKEIDTLDIVEATEEELKDTYISENNVA